MTVDGSEGWYREATNWLVGLAGAGIAGIAAYFGQSYPEDIPTAIAAILALVLFGLCIGAGVIVHFWHVRAQSAVDCLRERSSAETPEKIKALRQEHNDEALSTSYAVARIHRDRFHTIALTSFLLALVFLAAAILYTLVNHLKAPTTLDPRDCTPPKGSAHCIYWIDAGGKHATVLWLYPDRIVEQTWPASHMSGVASLNQAPPTEQTKQRSKPSPDVLEGKR